MTRFVGVAKGSRRTKPANTGGDRRTALAMFQVTGEHPELLEEATVGTAAPAAAPAVRTEVHLVFAAEGHVLGSPLAIKLFDDRAPDACEEFRARALGASAQHALEGAVVSRIETHVRLDVGDSTHMSAGASRQALEDEALRHDAPGTVSVDLRSQRVTITLSACPILDGKMQVIGRVIAGMETVQLLCGGSEATDESCRPVRRLTVCAASTAVGGGDVTKDSALLVSKAETKAQEAARKAAEKAETPAETRARLEREALAARNAVSAAVKEALHSSQRKAATTRVAGGMFDQMLAGSDGSDESDGS